MKTPFSSAHWFYPESLERGGPLLIVETEVNGDSKSTNEREHFLVWFVRLVVPIQEILVLPWLLKSTQYKILFSSPYTI